MAGIKPTDFPILEPNEYAENTELYTQTGGINKKMYLGDVLDLFSTSILNQVVQAYGEAYTTLIVDVTPTETSYSDGRVTVPSGILAMGTSLIELLPAAGVDSYYDIDSIFVEYTPGTTAYTYPTPDAKLTIVGSNARYLTSYMGTGLAKEVAIAKGGVIAEDLDSAVPYSYPELTNNFLYMSTATYSNWTLGDGTFKVKIKYKAVAFG